jgi:subtilisin family serine protease
VNPSNSQPMDDNGHGTHVAGTIAGGTNGIGVAPGVSLVICKALDKSGSGYTDDIANCIQLIFNISAVCPAGFPPVRIISASVGGSEGTQLDDVIKTSKENGILFVAAAGNVGTKCKSITYPGSHVDVIGVGSVGCDYARSSFSSRGPMGSIICPIPIPIIPIPFIPNIIDILVNCNCTERTKPDISAPGDMVVSANAFKTDGYVTSSGTSMATPHVAGVAALYLSRNPGKTWDEVKEALTSTAYFPGVSSSCITCGKLPSPSTKPNNDVGYGVVDAKKAVIGSQ